MCVCILCWSCTTVVSLSVCVCVCVCFPVRVCVVRPSLCSRAQSSYDNKVKLWSMRDHSLIKTMEGHEGRVMCADASDDGKYFATSAMDRTWKLWGR